MPFLKVQDQTGHWVTLETFPKRIVSLVPSQTELLHDLRLDKTVVGITKFCIHPNHWYHGKKRVGGTKTVNHDIVNSLEPDLIIANKEENTKEDILKLREQYNVWTSDIFTIDDNKRMIHALAELTNRVEEGQKIIRSIEDHMKTVADRSAKKVLYVIWNNPIMAAGRQTFINDMLKLAGFENALDESKQLLRYPELSDEDILKMDPEAILLSSEPFPFSDKHLTTFKAKFPNSDIHLVDGEMFSWYGSRLVKAIPYINSLKI